MLKNNVLIRVDYTAVSYEIALVISPLDITLLDIRILLA